MTLLIRNTLNLYRDAYADHPRQIWILAWMTLINRTGTMVLPFLAVYLKTVMGYSLQEAGILASAFGFGSLGGSYLGGKLTDKYGPRIVIIFSLFIGGMFFIGLQFAENFYPLFGTIFLAALFGEAYRPAMSAAAAKFVRKAQTGRTMALLRLAINLGMSMAPALGGFVAVSIGYKWMFWIDGLTCMAAALYFYAISGSWSEFPAHEEPIAKGGSLPPGKNIPFLWFLLSTFLIGFVFIQWLHTVPVFIKTQWGFDERYIGLLLGVGSLIVALFEMPLVHMIEQRNKRPAGVLLGIFLIGFSYMAFLLPKALLVCFVAMILWTAGEILYLPFNNAMPLNMSAPQQRGNYMSWYFMTWSVTNITGPLVGFAIIHALGFKFFWLVLLVMGLLALFIKQWLFRKVPDRI